MHARLGLALVAGLAVVARGALAKPTQMSSSVILFYTAGGWILRV